MKKNLFIVAAMLLFCCSVHAADWQRLSAPIMSPWGESINPDAVWQEYPRPQLKRTEWMNLNGAWGFYRRSNIIDLSYVSTQRLFSKTILVPFGVESALSGLMLTDYSSLAKSTLCYRRTFTLPESFAGKNVLMNFGAVDWQCKVYINGQEAGYHSGGSDPFSIDITDFLNAEGEQEVMIAVNDPTSQGGQPLGKQTTNPSGIWYTPVSGIWQTVWLEPVDPAHIERYEVLPDIDKEQVTLCVHTTAEGAKVNATVKFDGAVVATVSNVDADKDFTISLPGAHLWSPDEPNLYDVEFTLVKDGATTDTAQGYFGMRKFSKAMVDGHPAFMLNNKPFYMYGPLDQGWWPDGLLTPPSYEGMIFDLEAIKAFGMNMVRKHIKVEPDLWYEWCDRNGLVVWQDMPNGGTGGTLGSKEEVQEIFYDECRRIVNSLQQHPSIGVWVVYNEGWGQDAGSGSAHTYKGVNNVRNTDRDQYRLINAVTGWTDFEVGDIVDIHSYPAPGASDNPANERVVVCGEFGGITLEVEDHLWAGSQQVYTAVSNSDEYTALYNSYTDRLQELQRDKALWGSVYTQITDVEQEVNGLYTYDRKVLKVSEAQKASIRRKIEQTIKYRYEGSDVVVDAGDTNGNIKWNYTTTEPASGWETDTFDDSSWKSGRAGFGTNTGRRTAWSTSDIWLRRTFEMPELSEDDLNNLCLRMYYDEDTEVYINGVLACKVSGYNTSYKNIDINDDGLNAIKNGEENLIAIHCHQTNGGQYIDAGFSVRRYKANDDTEVTDIPEVTLPEVAESADSVYLMACFTSSQERLVYAYSNDGLSWQYINGGRGVFNGYDAGLRIRDPFVRRVKENGKDVYHLVHTWGMEHKGIYHWQSDDLINWTAADGSQDGRVMLMDGSLGGIKADMAYAPEFIYDEATATYFVYWTSLVNSRMRVYCTTTKDWKSFTNVYELTDFEIGVNNFHIVKTGDTYQAFFQRFDNQQLYRAKAQSLVNGESNFTNPTRMFSQTYPSLVSPASFATFGGEGMYMYAFSENDVKMFGTTDLENLTWRPVTSDDVSFPDGMDQGSVVTISKDELKKIIDANNYEETILIPTAEESDNVEWEWTTTEATDWNMPTFDSSGWNKGKSGFGRGNPPHSVARTRWDTGDIYLRHQLDLAGFTVDEISSLWGRIYNDEDVEVYLNGVLAYSATGYLTDYKDIAISSEALLALKPDASNIVAVHCHQEAGGQYIDFGIKGLKAPLLYDLNHDGKISTADIQVLINEMKKEESEQNMKYDLNGDGKISTADIQVIINEMKK